MVSTHGMELSCVVCFNDINFIVNDGFTRGVNLSVLEADIVLSVC